MDTNKDIRGTLESFMTFAYLHEEDSFVLRSKRYVKITEVQLAGAPKFHYNAFCLDTHKLVFVMSDADVCRIGVSSSHYSEVEIKTPYK